MRKYMLCDLQFTGSGTGSFYVKYNVVASPSGDFNKGYVYPTSNGQILRGSIGPTTDTTQTISFSIALEPTWTFSKPVNLTVRIKLNFSRFLMIKIVVFSSYTAHVHSK